MRGYLQTVMARRSVVPPARPVPVSTFRSLPRLAVAQVTPNVVSTVASTTAAPVSTASAKHTVEYPVAPPVVAATVPENLGGAPMPARAKERPMVSPEPGKPPVPRGVIEPSPVRIALPEARPAEPVTAIETVSREWLEPQPVAHVPVPASLAPAIKETIVQHTVVHAPEQPVIHWPERSEQLPPAARRDVERAVRKVAVRERAKLETAPAAVPAKVEVNIGAIHVKVEGAPAAPPRAAAPTMPGFGGYAISRGFSE